MRQQWINVKYAKGCHGTVVFEGTEYSVSIEGGALVIWYGRQVTEAHAPGQWLSVEIEEES